MTGLDYRRAADITAAAGLEWGEHVREVRVPGPPTDTHVLVVQGLQVLVAFIAEAARQCDIDEFEDLFGDAVLNADHGVLHVVCFPSCRLIDF